VDNEEELAAGARRDYAWARDQPGVDPVQQRLAVLADLADIAKKG
jgi:hypothetical protein